MSETIIPVILCGGSGTRLWPLSRASYPKQFSRLLGETSLFQASVERFPEPEFAAPIVVTNAEFRFIVTEQLGGIGRLPGAVLIEPEGRNTAPAVLAAALQAAETAPEGYLLVCPSDHAIADGAGFRAAVRAGLAAAAAGALVTFGIAPTGRRPATAGSSSKAFRTWPPPLPRGRWCASWRSPTPPPPRRCSKAAGTSGTAASSFSRSRRSSRPSPPISRRCWRRCAARSRAPAPTSPSSGSSARPSRRRRRSRSTTR